MKGLINTVKLKFEQLKEHRVGRFITIMFLGFGILYIGFKYGWRKGYMDGSCAGWNTALMGPNWVMIHEKQMS